MERDQCSREHLHVELLAPGKDLQASIKHDVMCDSKVLETWSEIAYIITPNYDAYNYTVLIAAVSLPSLDNHS